MNELKEHHSRKAMTSITASLPCARAQIDTGMSGGGVHHLLRTDASGLAWTRSRCCSQRTNRMRRSTPTMSSAMMSAWVSGAHYRREMDSQPVFQPSGAVGPSLSTNTMNVSPAVTRKAPSQSTRLSSSAYGRSWSMEKTAPMPHRTLSPVRNQNVDRHVCLRTQSVAAHRRRERTYPVS